MPTCSPSPFRSSRFKLCLWGIPSIPSRSPKTCWKASNVRLASAAAALAPRSRPLTSSDLTSHVSRTPQTTIHYTSAFIRRVLPHRAQPNVTEPESLEFWDEMLSRAQDALRAPRSAARIVVYGVDEYAGASQLVNALLEEAFASEFSKLRVRERWRSAKGPSSILLQHGLASQDAEGYLSVRSPWLQQFPVPVEIHELASRVDSANAFQHAAPLFSADIPIIVCNPLTTPLAELFANSSIPWAHTNTILVVTAPSAAPTPRILMECVGMTVPASLTVLFADPARAMSALDTLSSYPTDASSVQRYQDGFLESRVSDVTVCISKKLAADEGSTAGDILATLRKQNTLDIVSDSLNSCQKAVKSVEFETDRVRRGVSNLQGQMEEFRAKIGSDVLGGEDKTHVMEALDQAKFSVKKTMDRLTVWRILWKVDDVADTISASIDKFWCRDLENKLIFQTGRLSVTQNFLTGAANALLSSFPKASTFHSPVLQNTLAQLRTQPTHTVNHASLTQPIHIRRVQLTHPINALHASGQRTVIGVSGSVLGGLGVAWAGWAEQLGLLGSLGVGLETETAAGLGMFTAVAGVWYSMGRWEKAKRQWWRDWDRVGEGLERDLRTCLDRVVSDQVLVVPSAACHGLRGMIAKREDEITQLKDELQALKEDCDHR